MMERTKIYRALKGIRGRRPVDLVALEQLLVRFSQLVIEQPRICEIDINPLIASDKQLLALDARVLLHAADSSDAKLPRSVIRHYPRQYISRLTTDDGRSLAIRPIRPEDEPLLRKFHETLSAQSVYGRYAQLLSLSQRTVHERLARMCFIDYDRQIALVVLDEGQSQPAIVAVARLIKLLGTNDAEFAVIVTDDYQRRGLGSRLMTQLVAIGHDEKIGRIIGQISANNKAMLTICERLGFKMNGSGDPTTRIAILEL
jgi:acetyltransferase